MTTHIIVFGDKADELRAEIGYIKATKGEKCWITVQAEVTFDYVEGRLKAEMVIRE